MSPLTSSGQRSSPPWASQPQKSATLSPQPGGKPRKFIRTCGDIGGTVQGSLMMDPLWSETRSTFKYFIILIVSTYYILCISWIMKCLILLLLCRSTGCLFLCSTWNTFLVVCCACSGVSSYSSVSHFQNICWSNKCHKFIPVHIQKGGTRWRSWLRHCATSRKDACSIPDGVIGISHWRNPSRLTGALWSTQPLTEMSTKNISLGGSKARWYIGLTQVAQWLRRSSTNRKVAGSIPAGVIGIFHWHKILPIALWPWGRLSL